ncbi:MAG: hypothetical protein CVV56_00325 [Tenericutes bacterium HGW-Tenericutes-1]|jgi:RNA polymerase sigma-70 factor (ECF subfamily)|nr:MAG: hypothetical protein CVV56_00325 [Tenericutes bacterium HGW-Tenericutes-1]
MDRVNKLAKELKKGNIAVFDELYELTYKVLFYSVLSILKDKSKSEDIVQDTYMRMLKNIDKYQDNNFVGYLVTMGKNLAINEYTQRKRVTYTDTEYDFMSDFSLMSQIEIDLEHQDIINRALNALDESEKNVVIMHTISGLSHREIAEITQKPIGTITWIYAKAVKKMKDTLKEE